MPFSYVAYLPQSWVFRRIQKALSYIPQSLTSAMLAGVLLKFGIALLPVCKLTGVYSLYSRDLYTQQAHMATL